MKIIAITDTDGEIVGTAPLLPAREQFRAEQPIITIKLVAESGQSAHEIDLPGSLEEIELPSSISEAQPSVEVLHQVLRQYLSE